MPSFFVKLPMLLSATLAACPTPSFPRSFPRRFIFLRSWYCSLASMDSIFKKTKLLGGGLARDGMSRGGRRKAEVQLKEMVVDGEGSITIETCRSLRTLQKMERTVSLTDSTPLTQKRKRKVGPVRKTKVNPTAEKETVEFGAEAIAVVGSEANSGDPGVISAVPLGPLRLSDALVMADAIQHLRSGDPKLVELIAAHGAPELHEFTCAFQSLVKSIIYQQLAGSAAAAIHGRLASLCHGVVSPASVLALTSAEMRAIGISERKGSYLHDLAQRFASGELSTESILEMDDEGLMKALTAVKGIGVWSVHMFMMFSLHRTDVLPVGDLGVRKGFQSLFALRDLPTPAQMEALAETWRPYRSVGSWYMWRMLEKKKEKK